MKFRFQKLLLIHIFIFAFLSNAKAQNCSVNAGASGSICEGAAFVLDGSGDANVVSTVWTQVSGPTVGISDPTIYKPTITGATGGNTYIFRLTATCTDAITTSQIVSYTVESAPVSNAGSNISGCPGNYNLSANTPDPGFTGEWNFVGSNNANISINDTASPTTQITLPETSAGITVLEWRITDGNPATCDGVSTITITNIGGEAVVSADSNAVVNLDSCFDVDTGYGLGASFGGNGLGGQEGVWELVSGPNNPSFGNINNNSTTVSNLIEGSYVLRWSVSGPCVTGSDTFTINVPAPSGSVTNAEDLIDEDVIRICANPSSPTTEYLLVADPPQKVGETVEWTQTGGPTSGVVIDTPNNPTTLVTGLDETAGSNANRVNYTFRYTITSADGICTTSDNVVIRFIKTPLSIEITDDGTPSECIFADLNGAGIATVDFGLIRDNTNSTTRYSILDAPNGTYLSTPTSSPINTPTSYSGVGSVSSGNSTNANDFTLTFAEIGTYVIGVERDPNGDVENGCTAVYDVITVKISGTAGGANAGTDIFVCAPITTASLTGNTPTQGIGTWSQVSGPNTANITDTSDPSTTVTGLVSGVYYFRWSISSGPNGVIGANNIDEVKVAISTSVPTPATNFAGPDDNVCAGSYQLQANDILENELGTWSVTPSAGVSFSDPNDPKAIVSGLSTSTAYTFTYTITNTCGTVNDDVVITTNANTGPDISQAGSDQCISGVTSTALTATAASVGTGTWSQLSGPNTASFSSFNDPNATISGLVEGNYVFRWSIVDPSCPGNLTSDTVTVSLFNTTPSAGTDNSSCGSNSVTMNATAVSSPNQGTWVQTFGPAGWSVTDINSNTATFTGLSDGVYQFEWRVSTADCANNDKVSFSITNTPTPASLTSSTLNVCDTFTDLNANAVSIGVGTWEYVSGPNRPSINDTSDNNATVSGLVTGTYIYRWTTSPEFASSDAACNTSLTTSATLTLNVVVPADAGDDETLCGVDNVLLEGTMGSEGTWTLVSTSGSDTPTITTLNDNMARANIVSGNTYVFQYEITIPMGSSCTATSDTVTISNIALDTPIAGPDIDLCPADGGVATMAANTITSGTWIYNSGVSTGSSTPVITDASSATTTITNLNTEGTYIFTWQTDNGACINQDELSINVFEAPSVADAGSTTSICTLNPQLNAVTPTRGVGSWSVVGTPTGGLLVSFDSPSSPTTSLTLTNADAGDTAVLRWTVTNGASCPTSTDDITITITESTTATLNALTVTNSCQGLNNGTISTSGSGGSPAYMYNLLFSTSSGGVFIDATATDGDNDGSYSDLEPGFYKVVLTDMSACGEVESAEVQIVEVATPVLPTVSNVEYCVGDVASQLIATAPGTLIWFDTDGTTVLGSAPTPSTVSSGETTYFVSHSDGLCESAKVPVKVTVSNPVPQTISGGSTINVGQNITLTSTTGGGSWSSSNSSIATVNTSSGEVTGVASGSVTITYSVTTAGGCVNSDTETILVNDAPDAVDDTATVNEDASTTITVSTNDDIGGDGGDGEDYSLTSGPSNGTVTETSDGVFVYTPNADFNGTDSFTYTITDADGDTDTATVVITVSSVDDAPDAVDDTATVNEDASTTITVSTNDDIGGDGGDGEDYSLTSGPSNGTVTETSDGVFVYTPNADFNGTDSFTYTITDADGDTDTATVVITVSSVDDAPTATDDTATVNEDASTTITVSTNDDIGGDGGDGEDYSLTSGPSNGTVTETSDGVFVYTPNADFNGTDSFTYTITDADGDTDTATVVITV
ncbi:beta strand repeat-containing protein, partial [Tenacibaculum sp. 190524A05c]|uniref:beta strand repeat-containing protein n=1 Tax=Tenacibaculum platacis TaxID=3137852 RepID=UPI0032B2D241